MQNEVILHLSHHSQDELTYVWQFLQHFVYGFAHKLFKFSNFFFRNNIICGDSMEPLYLDGQIIWIHKQETLEEGEIGVFFLDGDAYVKKYHQSDSGIQLISLNKKYAPIQVTSGSTLKTFGKVVG